MWRFVRDRTFPEGRLFSDTPSATAESARLIRLRCAMAVDPNARTGAPLNGRMRFVPWASCHPGGQPQKRHRANTLVEKGRRLTWAILLVRGTCFPGAGRRI